MTISTTTRESRLLALYDVILRLGPISAYAAASKLGLGAKHSYRWARPLLRIAVIERVEHEGKLLLRARRVLKPEKARERICTVAAEGLLSIGDWRRTAPRATAQVTETVGPLGDQYDGLFEK